MYPRFKVVAKESAGFTGRIYRPSLESNNLLNLPNGGSSLAPPPANNSNAITLEDSASSSSVILFLAQKGSRVNEKDKYGLAPLHYAAMRGNDEAAGELLLCPDIDIEVHISS